MEGGARDELAGTDYIGNVGNEMLGADGLKSLGDLVFDVCIVVVMPHSESGVSKMELVEWKDAKLMVPKCEFLIFPNGKYVQGRMSMLSCKQYDINTRHRVVVDIGTLEDVIVAWFPQHATNEAHEYLYQKAQCFYRDVLTKIQDFTTDELR